MSHIAGASTKKVTKEDGREVPAKRRCAPDSSSAFTMSHTAGASTKKVTEEDGSEVPAKRRCAPDSSPALTMSHTAGASTKKVTEEDGREVPAKRRCAPDSSPASTMSHIAGGSTKKVMEEDGREAPAKRRCAPDSSPASTMSSIAGASTKRVREKDERKAPAKQCAPDPSIQRGYSTDTLIPFISMLYRKSSPSEDDFYKSVIFRISGQGVCGVKEVMTDILSMKTGVELPGMTAEHLMTHQALRDLVERILKKFKRVYLKGVEEEVVARCGGGWQHPERYTLDGDDVVQLLQCSAAQTPSTVLLQELPRGGTRLPEHRPLTQYQVWAAVMAVARRVLPREVCGSPHNLARLEDVVRHITLLGRHDTLFVGHLMHRWKVADCSWTTSFSTFQERTFIAAKFFRWIVERILMHTIGTMFHVTEMSGGNYQLHYYLKSKWSSIHDRALNALVGGDVVQLVSCGQTGSMAKKSHQKIRFLPKLKGVRPILVTAKSKGVKSYETKNALLFMRELCKTTGSISAKPAAAFGGMWQKFNEKLCAEGELGPLYFVRADVKDAYGSVLHSKLFELMEESSAKFEETMMFGSYVSDKVMKTGKRPKVTLILLNKPGKQTPRCQKDKGLEPMWNPFSIHVGKTLALVKQNITPVFRGGAKSLFKMVKGLPQGASLSPSLCEYYYSTMSTTHLKQFETGHSILLRTVDDFLFVSNRRVQAEGFLSKLKSGIPDFNCYINESKTVTNIHDTSLHRVHFNGVIVCVQSRQLLVDASGLVDIIPRYTLRLNEFNAPGRFVSDRVLRIINARLPSYVLCPTYTSTMGLLDNVWRVGFLTGARLVAMLHSVLAPRGPINARYVTSVVINGGRRVWTIVTSMWKRANKTPPVSKDVVMITFVTGVYVMLSWQFLPKWHAVYERVGNFLDVLIGCAKGDQALLPQLPLSMKRQ